jgi:heme/copper-type cytochrome/quinol oxidase subunit 1
MHMTVLPPVVTGLRFDYFDIVAVGWLIIGLLRGRKRGMSQELLPMLQWIGIVTAGGLLYEPFGLIIHHSTFFSAFWSNVVAYLLIAAGVHLVYFWFKQMFTVKLVERNYFGTREFYLGMAAGAVRYFCMLLAGLALMNARVATDVELAKTEKFQKENFSDVRFPTYGQFQQDVLVRSFSGNWIRSNLKSALIAAVAAEPSHQVETNAPKNGKLIAVAPSQPSKK